MSIDKAAIFMPEMNCAFVVEIDNGTELELLIYVFTLKCRLRSDCRSLN